MTRRAPQAEAADLAPVGVVAALLGLTEHRIRQLRRAGHLPDAPRGLAPLLATIAGYVAYLRAETSKPESAAASAAHDARAQIVANATARRRAGLVPRTDAESALDTIRTTAARHLRGLTGRRALAGLDAETQGKVEAEVAAALARIDEAHAAAVRNLRTGEMGHDEGAG